MTIASTLTTKQYTSTGVSTQFAYPNKIFSASDLVVTIFDLAGTAYPFTNFANATLGLSYSVQNVDVDTGCTVVLSAPFTLNWTIDIRTQTAQTQSTSIKNQGQFLPELHEEAFDRATRQIQDLMRLSYTYGIHGPDTETTAWPALPGVSTRKGKALMFDAATGLPALGVPNTQTITTGLLAPFLNLQQTAAESFLGVTPTNLQYPADPYVDPRRYGADPTGAADSTVALQTALNVAYQAGSAVFIGGKFLTGALSLTMSGAATKPLRIFGSAAIGSALLAKAGLASTSLLTFTTANPNTTLIEAFLVIENIQILSPSITVGVQGLSLFGIAKWVLRNVRIARFDVGLDIQNTENHTADCCEFVANRTGVRVALLGAFFNGMPTPTLQRFNNCVMNLNTFRGVDYNSGTGLYLIECGIEGNGTAADVTTGGVFIGNACSPDLQEGHVVIQNCWLENNKGWTVNQAAQVNGNLQRIAIKGCEIIGAESGRAVLISGSWIVEMSDLLVNSVGDTFNITCQYGHLSNITVNILTATGIVWPFFSNIQTAAGFQYFGRVDTWVATLTGCTTSPTANVTTIQQGDQVTFVLPELTAASAAGAPGNSCSLTGIPAKYQPTAGLHFLPAIIENNSIDTPQQVLLQVANNAIILFQGGSQTGFTAGAGTKGTRRGDIIFRLAA